MTTLPVVGALMTRPACPSSTRAGSLSIAIAMLRFCASCISMSDSTCVVYICCSRAPSSSKLLGPLYGRQPALVAQRRQVGPQLRHSCTSCEGGRTRTQGRQANACNSCEPSDLREGRLRCAVRARGHGHGSGHGMAQGHGHGH